jgi:uncharacterized membrane protein
MPSEHPTPSSRRVTWLAIGLFVSVLLNLFLAGVITGRLAGAGPVGEMLTAAPSAPSGRGLIQERFRDLPLSDRLRFRTALAAHRDALRQAQATLLRARVHALGVLAAPTYDPQAMADAFAAVRHTTTEAQAALHDALIQSLATLSPAARARLASPLRDEGG